VTHRETKTCNKYKETTIMKSDSERERAWEKKDWHFLVLVGIRQHFEEARNRVIHGWSRGGGGRKMCKEEVGWIVDLNNFLASCFLRSDIVGSYSEMPNLIG